MRRLPIYPTFKYFGEQVMLKIDPKSEKGNCYFHFVIEYSDVDDPNIDDHLGGYSLLYLDDDGLYRETGVDTDFDMDLDVEEGYMKITGVDLI